MDDLVKRADEALKDVTPGPWVVDDVGVDCPLIWAGDRHIAEVFEKSAADGGDSANARFIAAARDLVPEAAAALSAKDAEIAKLTAERDEARRRRDAWRARAENHVEIVNALRAKTAGKDSRTLSRALLGAAFVDAEARAEKAEAENARLRDALAHYATDENPDGWIAIAALTGENTND